MKTSLRVFLCHFSTILHQDVRVLVVHMGRDFMFDPCGRGMMVVPPAAADQATYLPIWLPANLDRIILAMTPCLEQPAGM